VPLRLTTVAQAAHKSLPLILAREFASNIATPVVVLDELGRLVFFNERAEQIIGQTQADVGELAPEEWTRLFTIARLDGTPVAYDEQAVGIAHMQKRPAHDVQAFTTVDGIRHEIEVTAIPLLGRGDELQGVVAVFWERGQT
jgi:PAS domain-containing protein